MNNHEAKKKTLAMQGFLVEVAGFEPAAFWSRTKRATKLRYTSMAGANKGTRTPDLLITNQLLYQLSYIGKSSTDNYSIRADVCPVLSGYFFTQASGAASDRASGASLPGRCMLSGGDPAPPTPPQASPPAGTEAPADGTSGRQPRR